MKIKAIEHVQLAMPAGREDDARSFYEGLLRIPERAKPEHLGARGGVWFETGALKIHLGVEAKFIPAKKAHLAFLVTGLSELERTLKKEGYKVQAEEPVDGKAHFYVSDPFGNRLEFMATVP